MLNLRDDVILKETVSERIMQNNAEIRDLLIENEQLIKMAKDPTILLTRKEVADRLRCDEIKIPRAIPRIRVGKNYLFQVGDVEEFINQRKRTPTK